MAENKKHWYDGWFYEKIIAPNQDKLFLQIKSLIEPGSTIIDIGCGTGRMEFILSDKCQSVLGIDLSKKNIDRANLTLLKQPDSKISFKHNNIREITDLYNYHFDYSILTYVIHEIDENERLDLLTEISQVADKIIIGDYLVPRPKNLGGLVSELIEFVAGKEHFRNYKTYMENGGIYYLAGKAGLKIINEIKNFNQIVVLSK